jgi:hypothetical protein
MNDEDIIKKLKTDALAAAAQVPIPKNKKAFLLADKIPGLERRLPERRKNTISICTRDGPRDN